MRSTRALLAFAGVAVAAILAVLFIYSADRKTPGAPITALVSRATRTNSLAAPASAHRVLQNTVHLPLSFEPAPDAAKAPKRFVSRGPGYALEISAAGASFTHRFTRDADHADPAAAMLGSSSRAVSHMRLNWLGANAQPLVAGERKQKGESNYLLTANRKNWRRHVAHYSDVKLSHLYPGVDLKFHGDGDKLEFDYLVAPGADPSVVRMGIGTPSLVNLNAQGQLEISDLGDELVLQAPVAYQDILGRRQPVQVAYVLAERHEVRLALGPYDKKYPLVIDPVLSFAAQFGATSNLTLATDVAVDSSGNIYLTGASCDVDYPVTPGALQSTGGSISNDQCYTAVITKLDPTASSLIYSTYLGSQNNTTGGIRILPAATGGPLVAGVTTALDFPTTANAYDTTAHGGICQYGPNLQNKPCTDSFLLQLSSDGSTLLFATYFGGSRADLLTSMTVDSSNNIYVAGATNSADFPTTSGAVDTTFGGGMCQNALFPCFDGFVAKFSSNGSQLLESTYLGGSDDDFASGLALDAAGNIYLTGSTNSTDFPVTQGAYQTTHSTGPNQPDAFVAKLTPDMKTISYATYIGGTGFDLGFAVKVDSTGAAYITGSTASSDFPTTSGTFQTTYAGPTPAFCDSTIDSSDLNQPSCGDIFVSKLNPAGSALVYSTLIGGSAADIALNLGLDSSNDVWLLANTASTDFPYTSDAYHTSTGDNIALVELSPDGKSLLFATPLSEGNTGQSLALGLSIDSADDVYVAGQATQFSPTPGTFTSGNGAIFVAKFVPGTARPGVLLSATSVTFPGNTTIEGSTSAPQTVTLTNNGTATLQLALSLQPPQFSTSPAPFSETDNCGTSLAASASCTINVVYQPTSATSGQDAAQITLVDNAPFSPQIITLNGTTGTIDAATFFPSTLTFNGQGPGTTSSMQTSGIDTPASQPGAIEPIPTGAPTISGPNAADFQIDTSNCTPALHGCEINVNFAPAANATGTRTASVSVPTNAPNSPQVLNLTGTVSTGPYGIFPAYGINVIPTMLGQTSNNNFSVQNTGGAALVATGFAITGANAADFAVAPAGCNLAFTIQSQQICSFELAFTPSAHGTRTATITLMDNETSPASVNVTAYGQDSTGPALYLFVSPSTDGKNVAFQGTVVGTTDLDTAYIAVQNTTGTASAQITSATITGDFAIATNTCTGAIAAGSSCNYTVSFTPTQTGTRTGVFTITTNAPGGQVFTLNFTGTGLLEPQAALTPGALTFAKQDVGSTSASQTVTLKNPGNGTLNIANIAVTGPFAQTTTCGSTLAAGASCTFAVKFAPTAAGPSSGLLTFSSNAAGGSFSVGLNGLGVTGPAPLFTPASLAFGNQAQDTASPAQTVTLSNAGDAPFTFSGLQSSENFSASSNCPTTLAAGASCAISIKFAPTADAYPGFSTNGAIYVATSTPNSPLSIPVTGTAVQSTGAASNIAIASSLNPSTLGQSVTFTATLTPVQSGGPTPTGSVTFLDALNGSTQIAPPATLNAGVAMITTSALALGTHSIYIMYSGDANYAPETSSGTGQTVLAPTTTTVASSQNPSTVGQSVTFTATVTSTTPGNIAGSVEFFDGATQISNPILLTNNQAVLATSSLTQGTHSITARFFAGPVYAASTSAVLSQVVNAAGSAATSTSVSSSLNPSTVGQSVTFTATVTSQTAGTITGTVTFYDGATQLGSSPLSSGMATYQTSSLTAATHSITATYSGDSNFATSTSTALSQVVNPAAKAATSTALASSLNPSTVGQSVTFTATVTSQTAGTITGTVTFYDGATQLGSSPLSGGMATFSTSALTQAAHSITAQYGGDANFASSTSTPLTQTVNAANAPPDFTLTASQSSLTLTAGQTGQLALIATPVNGSTQTLAFACLEMPVRVTCTFTPPSTTLDGAHPSTTMITVTTAANAPLNAIVHGFVPPYAALFHLPRDTRWRISLAALTALLLLVLALLLPGMFRLHPRATARLACALAALLAIFVVASCSSGSANKNYTGTPPGTYALVLDASASGGATHYVPVTLVVK